jgi:hypothetical protein
VNRHAFLADPGLAMREAEAFGETPITVDGRTVAILVAPRPREQPAAGPSCFPEETLAGAEGP